MSEFSTSLRAVACFKAGEDLAERLESVVKTQGSMAMALLKAATEIERLEELRKLDGESMGVLIAECQDMKDRLVNGDFIERLRNDVAGYTDGISAGNEAKQSYEKNDEKRINSNTIRLTDAEREAIYRAEARLRTAYVPDDETAATLRSLLERLK